MRKTTLFTIALFAPALFLNAQVPVNLKYTSDTNIGTASLKKGVEFEIKSVAYDLNYKTLGNAVATPTYVITATQSGKEYTITAKDLPKDLQLTASEDNLHNYWYAKNLGSLKVISEITNLYERRADIEADANEYIQRLSSYNLTLDDPFLESYLYSLVSKMVPNKRADGFPYDIRIVIVRDPSINAAVYPNGTMLVNVGLLSVAHTEDELVAVLAHEMAHFVANHTLVNIRKMEKAQARAEFWAGLGTVAAAAVAGVASASSGYYYYDGSTVANMAILSYSIASSVLNRIGMNYSKEQEEEADKMALDVIKYLGYDNNAVASIFQRMADVYSEEGNWAAYYLAGDHPSLADRIKYSGTPQKKSDSNYEKVVSFAVTECAITKFNQGRFTQAMKLADQNVKNGVATDDDYLIKALCLVNLYNDSGHNSEAATMIQRAKAINPNNKNILRSEIVVCLRNKDNSGASAAISNYIERINGELEKNQTRDSYYNFLVGELDWAKRMLVKVHGL